MKDSYNDLRQKTDNIANVLITSDLSKYNTGNLLGDKTGVSLFLFYYSLLSKNENHYNFAFDILEEVSGIHNNYDVIPTSLSKFGWLLQHLNKNGIIDIDLEEFYGNADILLFNTMIKSLTNNIYDFLHGALGIALYFLSKDEPDQKTEGYLTKFIDELTRIAEGDLNNGIKWISFIDYKKNTQAYNISMSHGITSIISILSKIYKRKINLQKTKYLLEGAVKHLLKQKLPSHKYNSIFPNLAIESMDNLNSSRLAWCYGDLGISIGLWHASQALGRKDWEDEAIITILHSAKRHDLQQNAVIDAGICHGTAGIAQIFKRMYGYSGLGELKEASDYWYRQTLEMARFENGLAGYKSWQGEKKSWVNDAGLLEGVAGIGLTLISAVSDIEPAWDECLLLS